MNLIRITMLGAAAFALTVAGCAAPAQQVQTSEGTTTMPGWAANPEGPCAAGAGKIRGSDINMARTAAANRARQALAASLDAKVATLIKDYSQSGEADGQDFNEELITKASKTLVNQRLQGSVPKKFEAYGNQMWAYVCMEPEKLAALFDGMQELGEKQREALRNRAEKAFGALDAEIDKQNQ